MFDSKSMFDYKELYGYFGFKRTFIISQWKAKYAPSGNAISIRKHIKQFVSPLLVDTKKLFKLLYFIWLDISRSSMHFIGPQQICLHVIEHPTSNNIKEQ